LEEITQGRILNMSLYNKYRPSSFDQIKGNNQLVSTLQGMLENKETFPHVILFHGQTGCGKTTLARIIANELECIGEDYQEINSANFRGIDTVRDLISKCMFKPLEGKIRVYVLDEIHKMTGEAQNALLKTLEEPPKHVYFILCTTEPHKLLDTIRGRCSQFQVNPLGDNQMYALLRRIARDEGQELDKSIFDQIIQDAVGHPRNALQILEQVLRAPADQRLEIARQAAVEQSQVIELCRALLSGEKWNKVNTILSGLKTQEAEDIRRMVLRYCQAVLLKDKNDRAAFIIECFWEPTYNIGFPGIVYCCYKIINL
jgi:DNA polymerase III gamma/tau subunit